MKKAFVIATAAACAVLLASCGYLAPLQGSGRIVTRTYSISGFTGISAATQMEVSVATGPDYSVSVSCDDNLFSHMTVSVKNGALRLGDMDVPSVNPTKMKATVTMPSISSVTVSGASNVSIDAVDSSSFSADVSGYSALSVQTLKAESVRAVVSGNSTFSVASVSPGASSLDAAVSGVSHLRLSSLPLTTAHLDVSGYSDAELNVGGTINGTASGASTIRYQGSASSSVICSGASSCVHQ